MAKFDFKVSSKHLQIDKANQLILISAAVTTVVVVFSLVAANSLIKQMSYQNKVIGLRSKASKQLSVNKDNVANLKTQYESLCYWYPRQEQ